MFFKSLIHRGFDIEATSINRFCIDSFIVRSYVRSSVRIPWRAPGRVWAVSLSGVEQGTSQDQEKTDG